jgi:small subunit ribosomal protein S8
MIRSIANVLVNKQFIDKYEEIKEEGKAQSSLKIYLKTDRRDPLELKRMSKPGQRIYVGHGEVKRVRNGLGVAIVSTSQGVMCDTDARSKKIGGEFICEVY